MRRHLCALVVGALTLPLVACQATARVAVTVTARGTGQVAVSLTLDRQAASRVGDLASALQIADLRRAGWSLVGPATASDGSVTATVQHPFRSPAEATALIAGLTAPGTGPPVQIGITRHAGLISSKVGVSGAIDLRGGVDAFADDALRKALGVQSLQAAIAQLQANGGAAPTLSAAVALHLPGRPTGVTGGGQVHGNTVTWTVPLGQRQVIGAGASSTDTAAEYWLGAAVVFLVALVAVLVLQSRVHRRSRDSWTIGGRRSRSRGSGRGPGRAGGFGRQHGHQDRWSLPTGPGSRR